VAVWGKAGTGRGEFNEPRGVAFDAQGNLFVADTKNSRIQKLSPSGEVLAVWGENGEQPGKFKDPHGIAVGPDGSVYVADTWNHRVQKFDNSGKFLKAWQPDPGFWGPRGIAVDKSGKVFVTDTGNKRIVSFNSEGVQIEYWGADGSAPGQLIEPVGIAVNDAGEVVVADTGNHRLQFFNNDGTFLREWPVFGWEEFYTEPYVATKGDDVFVTDSFSHRFARYNDNKLTGAWGRTGSGPGEFNRPIGIAVAPDGAVVVSDTLNNRLQKFELPGSQEK
jgi:tripartite motif-containing protein 71